MIKVLIVDDKLLMGGAAQRLLTTMTNIRVVGVADCGNTAVRLLAKHKPDILLIKLPLSEQSQIYIDQLQKKPEACPVVVYFPPFVGFDPLPRVLSQQSQGNIRQVSLDDFATAVLKASKEVLERQRENRAEPRTNLFVYSYLGIDKIPVNRILLLQADQKYVRAHMSDSVVTLNDSLVALEDEFRQLFVRIHRNALVAIDAIEGLIKVDNRIAVKIKNLAEQPTVSRRRASYLRQLLPLL